MAVLPTPGSPSSSGLFLVRRDRTCITLQKKRLHFNFSIFVPSLSWQTFGLKHYIYGMAKTTVSLPTNLFLPAYHRIQCASLRRLDQINPIGQQRLVFIVLCSNGLF
jgi:hypothetical protein